MLKLPNLSKSIFQLKPSFLYNFNVCQSIHTSTILNTFWEREKKSGYSRALENVSKKQLILDGLKELKKEINLWKKEVKEKLESDPVLVFRPGKLFH